MKQRRRQPKELNLDSETVKRRRQERKQLRKDTLQLRQKVRRRRQLENAKNGIVTGYKNKTQSISVLIPKHKDVSITEKHYQVYSESRNSTNNITVTMNIPTLNYVDQFWNWLQINKLPLNIIPLYPNIKEISESMAAYCKMKVYLSKIGTLLIVGDGSQPRTGALFAHLWPELSVYSVDPCLKLHYTTATNLKLYPLTIETFLAQNKEDICNITKGIGIVCVHSHADFDNYMPHLFSLLPRNVFVAIYALKCCRIRQSFSQEQLQQYNLRLDQEDLDFAAHTPDRKFVMWCTNL